MSIPVVITSCNRPHLLDKTLDSFFSTNTHPISKMFIIDDSLVAGCNESVIKKYSNEIDIQCVYNTVKIGQLRSIDLIYNNIDSEYFFHMEEDWLFIKSEFIEHSMDIMMEHNDIITVWLRGINDPTLNHPFNPEIKLSRGKVPYRKCEVTYPRGIWNGFTFNPSLKRMSDYNLIKPYQQLPRHTHPAQSGGNPLESDVSIAYAQLGYYAVTLLDQYITHIGWDDHII